MFDTIGTFELEGTKLKVKVKKGLVYLTLKGSYVSMVSAPVDQDKIRLKSNQFIVNVNNLNCGLQDALYETGLFIETGITINSLTGTYPVWEYTKPTVLNTIRRIFKR